MQDERVHPVTDSLRDYLPVCVKVRGVQDERVHPVTYSLRDYQPAVSYTHLTLPTIVGV